MNKKCMLCGGENVKIHEVNQTLIVYEYDDNGDRYIDSANIDSSIGNEMYDYCPDCNSYFHDDDIIDGRNSDDTIIKILINRAGSDLAVDYLNIINKYQIMNIGLCRLDNIVNTFKMVLCIDGGISMMRHMIDNPVKYEHVLDSPGAGQMYYGRMADLSDINRKHIDSGVDIIRQRFSKNKVDYHDKE